MISVETALAHLFDLVAPLPAETVPLTEADGRVLAVPVTAGRDQPPFAASAMDGYAVHGTHAKPGAKFTVIGEAAAGHRFHGTPGTSETVRIFTGAPLPEGCDRVIIQEDVTREGDVITLNEPLDAGPYVRPSGGDFTQGTQFPAPRRLGPHDVALLAAMNAGNVQVTRRPSVAILATGDELVMPGETPGPDQIIASNSLGLAAMVRAEGGEARLLPIARDTEASLQAALGLAQSADLIVTIGGASVGDHDLVGKVAGEMGLDRAFYKVAMRPGKPLMAGRIGGAGLLGLPGNPVSAMVCGHVFLRPMLRVMLGLGAAPAPKLSAPLACDLPQNGPREHYMRAVLSDGTIRPAPRQDSALLSVLAEANCLMIRPARQGPKAAGVAMDYILL